ncbi:MAG TPA: hypothetical protein VMT61_01070 [Candidatus Binataceae bacterium]|nr:hypothetical protein [Candidatus Binataceae bacterium]
MKKSNASRFLCRIGAMAAAAAMTLAAPAWSAQPRPWLCRQIPVFSSSSPMTWQATKRGAGRWLVIFMHYDPAGGHDGFTVVSTNPVNGQTQGSLDAGHWYAVAQYDSGGHWICPANASASSAGAAGAISNLCFGEDDGACDVKLTVKSSGSSASAAQ